MLSLEGRLRVGGKAGGGGGGGLLCCRWYCLPTMLSLEGRLGVWGKGGGLGVGDHYAADVSAYLQCSHWRGG